MRPMVRAALLVVVSLLTACGAPDSHPSEPTNTNAPPSSSNAPSGKRVPCTFGADQTCNDDPKVSSLWGRCTELGACECKPGFELGPSGYCRPAQN